mmetsp:Transcript_41927/g.119894  ORF Transcript_41927/g.119894 Transcript_41927/m.119894 type:complete len:200 (+) Transcript_41927:947-1546(+)
MMGRDSVNHMNHVIDTTPAFQCPARAKGPTHAAAACNVGVDIPETSNTSMAAFKLSFWPLNSSSRNILSLSDATEDLASRRSPVNPLLNSEASFALCKTHNRSHSDTAAEAQSTKDHRTCPKCTGVECASKPSRATIAVTTYRAQPAFTPLDTAATCASTCIAREEWRKEWRKMQKMGGKWRAPNMPMPCSDRQSLTSA